MSLAIETTPVAAKVHLCAWCNARIEKGAKHVKCVRKGEQTQYAFSSLRLCLTCAGDVQ